jgi:DNA topoisomerase-1
VKALEDKGIGRPSTFSSLISKIQDRQYVLKEDIPGRPIKCVDFELKGDELEEIITERTFGGERNKLVIQPTGVLVLEFLLKNFDPLFKYEYTKKMETSLDRIAKGDKVWHTLCLECHSGINLLSEKIAKDHRESMRIDQYHTYIIGKYGPVIRCDKEGETSFLSVKKGIDITKLREGRYCLEEIVENKSFGRELGEYKGGKVMLKKGKYGLYVSCNGKNYSVKHLKKKMERVELADVTPVLSGERSANPNVLRMLREDLSVRKGKWGPYLFYKTDVMKKPKFLKLKGFDLNPIQCSKDDLLAWVREAYQI